MLANKKKLFVFDFDGTLFNTPEPTTGKLVWEKNTGIPYPYFGWWGRKESLDTDIFDIKPIQSTISILLKEKEVPDNYIVILSSRPEKLRKEIENILQLNNIKVDEIILKSGNMNKPEKLLGLMERLPNLEEIDIFDDRIEEISLYLDFSSLINDKIECNIYQVLDNKIIKVA